MRTREIIYDDLLRFQTELSFDIEQSFFPLGTRMEFRHSRPRLGAGNSYYTRRLAEKYPAKQFTCVERDTKLAARARQWAKPYAIEVVEGSFDALPQHVTFDFVLIRHAFSYLSDRVSFASWISSHTSPGAGVLVIDADDEQFFVNPRSPLLERGNEEFKQHVSASGGKRKLRDTIAAEWEQNGFRHATTTPLVVHSDIRGRRALMHSFMTAVAEYDHSSPLPTDVREELETWIHDPQSYLQYGLFGSSFQKAL